MTPLFNMPLLHKEFRDFIYGELTGMVQGLAIMAAIGTVVLQTYVENKRVEIYKNLNKYPAEQKRVMVDFYDAIFAGKISFQDAKFVVDKINSARKMALDARVAMNKDIIKARDIVINANSELDRANQRLKRAPELQKYLEPTRATVLNIRKQLVEYSKKQKVS